MISNTMIHDTKKESRIAPALRWYRVVYFFAIPNTVMKKYATA